MRILPGLDAAERERTQEPTATPSIIPIALPVESPDQVRLDTIEEINATLLQRIQRLEERLAALEAAPKTEAAPIPPIVPTVGVTVDAEALKKGLLDKMWKHLNDR
jgi:hypothetical protein